MDEHVFLLLKFKEVSSFSKKSRTNQKLLSIIKTPTNFSITFTIKNDNLEDEKYCYQIEKPINNFDDVLSIIKIEGAKPHSRIMMDVHPVLFFKWGFQMDNIFICSKNKNNTYSISIVFLYYFL